MMDEGDDDSQTKTDYVWRTAIPAFVGIGAIAAAVSDIVRRATGDWLLIGIILMLLRSQVKDFLFNRTKDGGASGNVSGRVATKPRKRNKRKAKRKRLPRC